MKSNKFKGKSLLVLGSNTGAVDIVNYARENGAHTIVADYYSKERSAAKQYADEQLLISTADLDQLGEIIEKRHINGVLAGISEFNLLNALALSERYALPFYCSRTQWDMIENKYKFRLLCQEHGVPCPRIFYYGGKTKVKDRQDISFPVVLKPVDGSASVGVFICNDEMELLSCEDKSLEASGSGKILIEEYILGDEFTAHYTVSNGVVSLSCVDNRYPIAVHMGNVTTVPAARVYPSLFLDSYCKQVDPAMQSLCKKLGLTNGILFIQGIYNTKTDSFYIFEAGLRCAGEAPYRLISRVNGENAMNILVDHALDSPSTFDSGKEDPTMKGKCCGVISFVGRGGVVGNITGLENAVEATPSVVEYENRYPIGREVPNGDTLRQLMLRFFMICESREQMVKDIDYLYKHITVLDKEGNDMIIKLQPERILGNK